MILYNFTLKPCYIFTKWDFTILNTKFIVISLHTCRSIRYWVIWRWVNPISGSSQPDASINQHWISCGNSCLSSCECLWYLSIFWLCRDWRDNSVLHTWCSCRRPDFSFYSPHNDSQLSVCNSSSRRLASSSGIPGNSEHVGCTNTYADKTLLYLK